MHDKWLDKNPALLDMKEKRINIVFDDTSSYEF